jgi:hypothetical protein
MEKSKNLLQKPGTLIISFLGVLGTIIGLYTYFFPAKVELNYEIISETNLLEIDEDVTSLSIQYAGEDLKATNSNLGIITLSIKNNGETTLLKNYYDVNDLWGFQINGGRIIEIPKVTNSSNDYLKKNILIDLKSSTEVRFSDVILEPNDYFIIKFSYLYTNGKSPEIIPIGKVAEVKNINISKRDDAQKKPKFQEAFQGDIWIQILRAIVYMLIGLMMLITIALCVEKINDIRKKFKRKKDIKEFRRKIKTNLSDEIIFERYLKDGAGVIFMMKTLLKNEDILKKKYEILLSKKKKYDNTLFNSSQILIEKMVNDKIIIKSENGHFTIDQSLKSVLFGLVNFLQRKGIKVNNIESLMLSREVDLEKVSADLDIEESNIK